MSKVILRIGLLGVALVVGSAGLINTAPASARECHAKSCTIGGQSGVCCVETNGSIDCSDDCGAVELQL